MSPTGPVGEPLEPLASGAADEPRASRSVLRRVLSVPGLLVRTVLLALLWVYRNTISPMRGPTCRYHPSCSAYAVEALHVHGAAKGSALAVARVCRCHPWADGGVDPVPPKGSWRNPTAAAEPADPGVGDGAEPMTDPGVDGAEPMTDPGVSTPAHRPEASALDPNVTSTLDPESRVSVSLPEPSATADPAAAPVPATAGRPVPEPSL